jgi:hypothetical protein
MTAGAISRLSGRYVSGWWLGSVWVAAGLTSVGGRLGVVLARLLDHRFCGSGSTQVGKLHGLNGNSLEAPFQSSLVVFKLGGGETEVVRGGVLGESQFWSDGRNCGTDGGVRLGKCGGGPRAHAYAGRSSILSPRDNAAPPTVPSLRRCSSAEVPAPWPSAAHHSG